MHYGTKYDLMVGIEDTLTALSVSSSASTSPSFALSASRSVTILCIAIIFATSVFAVLGVLGKDMTWDRLSRIIIDMSQVCAGVGAGLGIIELLTKKVVALLLLLVVVVHAVLS